MGNSQKKEATSDPENLPVNLVLMGEWMSGKRTQAYLIQDTMKNMCHVKVEDLKIKEILAKTDIGKKMAKQQEETGDVSDDLVLGLLQKKIDTPECSSGFVLTDFPTKASSAEGLDNLLKKRKQMINKVIYLKVPLHSIFARLNGCMDHPASGRRYHLGFLPPKKPNRDNVTGDKLLPCLADTEQELYRRNGEYRKMMRPVAKYYIDKGVMMEVDGDKTIGEVSQSILSVIMEKKNETALEFLETLQYVADDILQERKEARKH